MISYVVEIMSHPEWHQDGPGERIFESQDIEQAKAVAKKEQSMLNLLGFNEDYITLDEYQDDVLVKTIEF